ncbi:hypothetical protein SCUP515_01998 [Seiridium cupressi]
MPRGSPGRKKAHGLPPPSPTRFGAGQPEAQVDKAAIVMEDPCPPFVPPVISTMDHVQALVDEDQKLAIQFAVVPGLAFAVRRQAWICSVHGPPMFRETFLALKHVFETVQRGRRDFSHTSLLAGADALRTLRNATVNDQTSLIRFLSLTALLQSFDRLVHGISTQVIMESTLIKVRSTQIALDTEHQNISVALTCLIFIDTANCLLKSRIPIMKIPSPHADLPDRLAGLCGTLLPLLYNTCCLLHSIRKRGYSSYDVTTSIQWQEVYQAALGWEPCRSSFIFENSSHRDRTVLLSQRYAYRAATILILDQVRPQAIEFPWGSTEGRYGPVDDNVGIILDQAMECVKLINRPPPFTNVPPTVAALEAEGEERRGLLLELIQQPSESVRYAHIPRLKEIVTKFWNDKDTGVVYSWLTFLQRADLPSIFP